MKFRTEEANLPGYNASAADFPCGIGEVRKTEAECVPALKLYKSRLYTNMSSQGSFLVQTSPKGGFSRDFLLI